MKSLIKINDPTDIITEPFPEWLDPVAFSIFDCYGYALCKDYDEEIQDYLFSILEIENPYKESETDPDVVIQHIATPVRN